MKRKHLSKITQYVNEILDESNEEINQSTTTTSQAHASSTTSRTDTSNTNSPTSNIHDSNVNPSTSNFDNLNVTNSDNNMSTQTSLNKQGIGGRTMVSKVWLYAKKLDGGEKAACLLCDFTCSSHSHSTSTIRQHLISKHKKTDLILKSSIKSKPVISEALKKELHQLCYYSIIKDSRSFNDLNKTGIRTLINKLCPGYSPPHRNQVSRQLKFLYNHHYQLLKEELKQVYRLGVTLDFWSNHRNESFLCVTGHWFTDSLDPVSKIIDFSSFNSRHTGIEIANVLKEKFIELGVYEKVICITCDGAENLVLACEYLRDDIIRIWCCAHRLHLVVINALGFWLSENKLNNNSSAQSSTDNTTINTTTSSFINHLYNNSNDQLSTDNTTINNTTSSFINYLNNNSNHQLSTDNTTINTTTSSFINHDNGNEPMDVNWDYELNENSWIIINEPDLNDETNEATATFDDEMMNGGEYDDEIHSLNGEEITDETDMSEFIYDSWSVNFDIDVNPTDEQKLIMNLLKKCRAIAKIMKKSSIISEFIRQEKQSLHLNRTVNIDCKTRWNSTYVLTDSLIYLKHLIIKLFSEKRSLKLRSDQIQKLSTIELNSEGWDLLSSLHYVLKPFFFATTMMSGKQYPSIGLSYYAIQKIKWFCIKDDNSSEQIKKLKKLLLDKLDKYFHNDSQQLQYLQRYAYFDPTAHLCLTDKEKQQIEVYIKQLIVDDVYPFDLPTTRGSTASSSTITFSSMSYVAAAHLQPQLSTNTQSKPSAFDEFIAACGEEETIPTRNVKERSKRIYINEELKYFKLAVQEFNVTVKPSASSALQFWKIYKDRLPLLSHLAKIHLVACATSVPSESAFSSSAYIARKERARLSGENLAYTVFLKDKILIDG